MPFIGRKTILSTLSTTLFAAVLPPEAVLNINNRSACTLEKHYTDTYPDMELSTPGYIDPDSHASGKIHFSNSLIYPHQHACSQYVITCHDKKYTLALNFFTDYGMSGNKLAYYFHADYHDNSPFLVFPTGKVLIQNKPLDITLLNKEVAYETMSTDLVTDPSPESCEDNGYFTDPEPDNLQDQTIIREQSEQPLLSD